MDADLFLVIGLIVIAATVPALLTAFVEGRVPRVTTVILLAGGIMVGYAAAAKPGGYEINQLPTIFRAVADRYL